MEQMRKSRGRRVVTIFAGLSIVTLGVWEIKVKDHGLPRFGVMFQIAVALLSVAAEITGLLQEPS